jgi:hypothetical protein
LSDQARSSERTDLRMNWRSSQTARKKAGRPVIMVDPRAAGWLEDPAMTDFRAFALSWAWRA